MIYNIQLVFYKTKFIKLKLSNYEVKDTFFNIDA